MKIHISMSLSLKCQKCLRDLHDPSANIYGFLCPKCWHARFYTIDSEINELIRQRKQLEQRRQTEWANDPVISLEKNTRAYKSLIQVIAQTKFDDFRFLHQRNLCHLVEPSDKKYCELCTVAKCAVCGKNTTYHLLVHGRCKPCIESRIKQLRLAQDNMSNEVQDARRKVYNSKFM